MFLSRIRRSNRIKRQVRSFFVGHKGTIIPQTPLKHAKKYPLLSALESWRPELKPLSGRHGTATATTWVQHSSMAHVPNKTPAHGTELHRAPHLVKKASPLLPMRCPVPRLRTQESGAPWVTAATLGDSAPKGGRLEPEEKRQTRSGFQKTGTNTTPTDITGHNSTLVL